MFSGVSSSALWIFEFLHGSHGFLQFSTVLHGSLRLSEGLHGSRRISVSVVLHGCVRVPVSKESLRFAQCRFG